MYEGRRIGLVIPVFNEMPKIVRVVERLAEAPCVDEVVCVDDGSTDGTTAFLAQQPRVRLLRHPTRRGIGATLRTGFAYLLEHSSVEIVVIMAGNDKDRPAEIPRLLAPIVRGKADFVQGSRYLPGGVHGRMPLLRVLGTRLYPWFFWLATGRRLADGTNGFRAVRAEVLRALWPGLSQAWLDGYELEYYLLYHVARGPFALAEVPVTKLYPARALGYSKVRLRDWWSIIRPLVLLKLRIKE